jgi:hypothetical protein
MNIPRDKLIHAAGGAIAAAGCGVLAWVALNAGLSPLAVAVLAAGLAAALSVEAAQWSANRAAIAAGQPVQHEVSPLDALASFAPAVVLAAVVELASGWLA